MTPYPQTPPQPGPSCYRHAGRETYIRCNRCDRPICPDCMVGASVGFQCPECVAEGARTTRQPRTIFGGIPSSSGAVVTWAIIGICAATFVLQKAIGISFEVKFALISLAADEGELIGVAAGEYYRLLTASALHADLLHLLFNMYALFLFGRPLEAELGRVRYTALYVLSALGGFTASYLALPPGQLALGASGGVLGLMTATLVVNRRMRRDNRSLWVLLAIIVVYGFISKNTDWQGHFGGMAVGAAAGAVLVYAPRERRTRVQVAGLLLIAGLVAGVVTQRTLSLADTIDVVRGRAGTALAGSVLADGTQTLVHTVDK